MNNSLEYDAALEMLKTHRYSTDPVLIEMLCGVLGLPLPNENGYIGFHQQSNVPTVGDVEVVYEAIKELVDRDGEGEVAYRAAGDGNERLVIYYLTAYKNKSGDMTRYAGSAIGILLGLGRTNAVKYIIEILGVVPSLYDLSRSYGKRDSITDNFRLWLLSVIDIGGYEEERRILNTIFGIEPIQEILETLINRLLEVDGYREMMQLSFDLAPLAPFGRVPLKLDMVRFFESKGFRVMPTRDTHPGISSRVLSAALSYYTRDTDDDRYLWNYLVDEMDAIPALSSLNNAAGEGNFSLVKFLIDEGIQPDYTTFVRALGSDDTDISDYLFPLVEGDIKGELDFNGDHEGAVRNLTKIHSLEAMGIFLNRYWDLSIGDIDAVLLRLYRTFQRMNKEQIMIDGRPRAGLLYNLLRSISSGARRTLLQLHSGNDATDIWIRRRILEVMDDV